MFRRILPAIAMSHTGLEVADLIYRRKENGGDGSAPTVLVMSTEKDFEEAAERSHLIWCPRIHLALIDGLPGKSWFIAGPRGVVYSDCG